jgi:septal ring factor EnvC (AmiA/AmiB activator)
MSGARTFHPPAAYATPTTGDATQNLAQVVAWLSALNAKLAEQVTQSETLQQQLQQLQQQLQPTTLHLTAPDGGVWAVSVGNTGTLATAAVP